MAWDAYLKIDGVDGESKNAGHEGEIEIMSFSFGGSNPASIGIGGGGGVGTVSLSSVNMVKWTDLSSVALFKNLCSGGHFPEAVITMYKAGGDAPLDYLIFTFKQFYIDNISWSGSQGGSEIPTESVSASFASVEIEYKVQNPEGGQAGGDSGGWDVVTGEPI